MQVSDKGFIDPGINFHNPPIPPIEYPYLTADIDESVTTPIEINNAAVYLSPSDVNLHLHLDAETRIDFTADGQIESETIQLYWVDMDPWVSTVPTCTKKIMVEYVDLTQEEPAPTGLTCELNVPVSSHNRYQPYVVSKVNGDAEIEYAPTAIIGRVFTTDDFKLYNLNTDTGVSTERNFIVSATAAFEDLETADNRKYQPVTLTDALTGSTFTVFVLPKYKSVSLDYSDSAPARPWAASDIEALSNAELAAYYTVIGKNNSNVDVDTETEPTVYIKPIFDTTMTVRARYTDPALNRYPITRTETVTTE